MSPSSTSKPAAWLRAARLEFHPVVLLMLGAGAAAGALDARSFDPLRALLAWACLFLIQFAAVLTNEHFDFPGDMANHSAGRFSGGSRVIVTGALTHDEVLRAVAISIALLGAASGLLLAVTPHEARITTLVLIALGVALGLGHTAPPLKLGHRGFGEINAAFTLGTFPALAGWVTQGGAVADPTPWLISMPAFCALLGSRTLAGIPDIRADLTLARRTYAVIFGARGAAAVAVFAFLAASLAGVLLWQDRIVSGHFGTAYLVTVPHAAVLSWLVIAGVRGGSDVRRLDGILLHSLLFTLWFGLIPCVYFMRLVRG